MATQGMFMHKNKLYQQYDGVSMGSPLGPTIANFFLANMENKILQNNADFHPKLYLRYVDDIFCIFNNETSSDRFLDLLNKQHKNIKFTAEHGSETLPFLDVEVTITESGIETKIYRKQTHTNLLLNFNAICPMNRKYGLILCLLNRAKIICSTTALFQKEVTELRSMFQENGYPKSYFDKIFKRFLTEQSAKEKNIPDTSEKENYYITIPYLESESRRFINKLAKIIKNKINVNIVPVYKSFKIGRYFQLKFDTPLALCSNVVYKFTCSCDMNLTYYGMSTRHLITRVREHLDFNSIQRSAIKDHILSCDVCSDVQHGIKSFTVIKKCQSKFHTKIHEALLIKKDTPKLNRQLYGKGASFLLQVF